MIDTTRHPAASDAFPEVMAALADAHRTAGSAAAVIRVDGALAGWVLTLARAEVGAGARSVRDVDDAVLSLGWPLVRALAVATHARRLDPDGTLADHEEHAVRVATAARLLAPTVDARPSDAFAAGLLHDVGELLLFHGAPAEYLAARGSADTHVGQLRAEKEAFGTDHALAGAEHLLDWRLPDVIADAVADHHDPFHTSSATTIVVAAADELVNVETGRTHALDLLELDVAAAEGLRRRVDDEAAELLGLLPLGA